MVDFPDRAHRGTKGRKGSVLLAMVLAFLWLLGPAGCKVRRQEGAARGAVAHKATESARTGGDKADDPTGRPARSGTKVSGPTWVVSRAQAKAWAGALGVAESPTMYSSERLYELLDGGADRYVKKGVVRTAFVELGKADAPACRVTLFLLKDAQSAVGLLKDEKDPGWLPYKVADQAFGDKEGLVFRKGRILGRVEKAGPDQACPFQEVAKKIASDRNLPFFVSRNERPGKK